MWGIVVALLSGALMSVQGVFNTELTKSAGIWITAAWVQMTAFIVCVAGIKAAGEHGISKLFLVSNKYMLLGGVLGAFITFTVIKSMDSLGPAGAVLIIVVAQIAMAYFIELFGIFGSEKSDFSWQKIIGIVVAVVGIIIFQKGK